MWKLGEEKSARTFKFYMSAISDRGIMRALCLFQYGERIKGIGERVLGI